jgi:hypothetical protein
MANLGDIGLSVPDPFSQRTGNEFTLWRAAGMIIEIDPAPSGAVLSLTRRGVLVDTRRTSDDDIARFYDLEPGNYIATVTFGTQSGTAWRIVVTPTTYTVTRVSSTAIRTWGAQA